MKNPLALRVAAVLGFLAVALGAFGAHGLKEVLARNDTAAIWQTAVLYHLVHSVMLFIVSWREPVPAAPWFAFVIGIVLFSGSLYVLGLTGLRWLGAITPFGGVGFLVGWGWLAITAPRALSGRG